MSTYHCILINEFGKLQSQSDVSSPDYNVAIVSFVDPHFFTFLCAMPIILAFIFTAAIWN